jgi:hemerythrin-like metal-binding protein
VFVTVGIKEIDDQHQHILELAELVDTDTTDEAVLVNRMSELVLAVIAHFQFEEAMMKSRDYKDYLPHKKEHENMLLSLRRYYSRMRVKPSFWERFFGRDTCRLRNERLRVEILGILTDWTYYHVVKMDIALIKLK